ncbi:MAG: hypothetical protein JSS35_08375 [Proteobacteria bacterium]|nr:hypothetical protein [Pseudomonadota bacterium]
MVVLVEFVPPAVLGAVVVVVVEPSGLVLDEVDGAAASAGAVVVVEVVEVALSAAGAAALVLEVSSAFLLQPARPTLSAAISAPAVIRPVCGDFNIWKVSLVAFGGP